MSYIVTPFEILTRSAPEPLPVRFVHLLSGIATRHSDTIDCIFRVGGRKATVAISCATLTELREREGKYLRDQQLAEIAALHLRRTLQNGYDATLAELFLGGGEFRALGRELGYI
ncbi:MAG: hypothetical protein ACE145_13555 [Terriglobia bacterium]